MAADTVAMMNWPVSRSAGAPALVEVTRVADLVGVRLPAPARLAEAENVGEITLPAEALLRLAYGRLDPAHTPSAVHATAGDLARLRAVFPGF